MNVCNFLEFNIFFKPLQVLFFVLDGWKKIKSTVCLEVNV